MGILTQTYRFYNKYIIFLKKHLQNGNNCDIIYQLFVGICLCYSKFYSKLQPSLQRIHGKVKHSGKAPMKTAEPVVIKEKNPQDKIADLEKEMAKAVETQNFERAAAIRDEIKQLKGEN